MKLHHAEDLVAADEERQHLREHEQPLALLSQLQRKLFLFDLRDFISTR